MLENELVVFSNFSVLEFVERKILENNRTEE